MECRTIENVAKYGYGAVIDVDVLLQNLD